MLSVVKRTMIVAELSTRIKAEGFEDFGFVSLKRPLSLPIYRQWLADGCHAEMKYLEEHLPLKETPQKLMPRVRAAIVLTVPYYPAEKPRHRLANTRTALYAQLPDYHNWFVEKLEKLSQILRQNCPGEEFLCYADSKPVPERELGVRAGLGWIGKNGCLISPKKGSLFFIGEIYTTLDLEEQSSSVPDHCGTCDRCIRSCPTQAIRDNRTLDSRLCISYWTIEAKTAPPENLRQKFGDWFFGCDICQTVCPWNEKVFGKKAMRALSAPTTSSDLEADLRWCLASSNRELEENLREFPLLRARGRGLKRNALIVIGNLKMRNLAPEVKKIASEVPLLRDLALQILDQLES